MDASPPPIGRTAKPEPSPPNRAGIRRAAARAAQNKAASNLAQALRDLAKEKIARQVLEEHSLHLEQRLDASVRENLELRQDISNLHYELASARAADVPSLLESIGLVLRLHQLVVSNCDSADRQACACPTTPPPLASPRQLDADLPSPAPGLASPTAQPHPFAIAAFPVTLGPWSPWTCPCRARSGQHHRQAWPPHRATSAPPARPTPASSPAEATAPLRLDPPPLPSGSDPMCGPGASRSPTPLPGAFLPSCCAGPVAGGSRAARVQP